MELILEHNLEALMIIEEEAKLQVKRATTSQSEARIWFHSSNPKKIPKYLNGLGLKFHTEDKIQQIK